MTDFTTVDQLTCRALKKLRELSRDLLFLKYGDTWALHDKRAGKFFAVPDTDEIAMLEAIARFADNRND